MSCAGHLLFLLCTFAHLADLLISDSTPFEIDAVLANPRLASFKYMLRVRNASMGFADLAEIALDYSYSPAISGQLQRVSRNTVVFCMYRDCSSRHVSEVEYATQVEKYLVDFNFTKAFLVSHSEGFYHQVAVNLLQKPLLDLKDHLFVDKNTSKAIIEHCIGKVFKPSGNKIAVFLVNGEIAKSVIEAIETFHVYKAGYGYIFAEETAWSGEKDGILYVTDSITAQITTRAGFEAALMANRLAALQEARFACNLEGKEGMAFYCKEKIDLNLGKFALSLVNINRGNHIIVQKSDVTGGNIRFPGNSSAIPIVEKPTLEVSIDFQGESYNGNAFVYAEKATRGYLIAYKEADLLPNYQVRNFSVSPGAQYFNYEWAVQQLVESRERLGLAFHPFSTSTATMGIYKAMEELGISIPISSVASPAALSSPEKYPLFYRTGASSVMSAAVMAIFFRVFGWKRAAVIYSDSLHDQDFYSEFLQLSAFYGIEITNSEANRLLPSSGLSDVQDQVNRTIGEIVASTVRIIVIACPESYYLIEKLYDFGARPGDYLICLYYGLAFPFYAGPFSSAWKRRNAASGALLFSQSYFIGPEGERVKQLLTAVDDRNYEPVGCAMYDSAMLLLHAVKSMLARGLHFEVGTDLMEQIRETRFVGCTGVVQLESGTNDNIVSEYSVISLQYNQQNDTLSLKNTATYSPTRVVLFTMSKDVQFPDGSQRFLDTWPMDPNCPYYLRHIRDFTKGKALSLAVALVFVIFTLIESLITLQHWKNMEIPILEDRKMMSAEDCLSLFTFIIEYIQLIAIAPAIDNCELLYERLGITSLEWEFLIHASHGVFWALTIITFILSFLLFSCEFGHRCRLRARLNPDCCPTMRYFLGLLIPAYARIAYMPILLTLLSCFNCYRSVGDSFTDSFLNRDCYEMCWTGRHLVISILAAATVLALVPVALKMQLHWQLIPAELHVLAYPQYIAVKFGVETALVASAAMLKEYYSSVHAYLFLSTMILYLLSQCLFNPYNYER